MSTPTLDQTVVAGAVTSRAVQLAIRAQLMLQVTKLWPLLDPKRLDASWPAWLAAMKLLTTTFHAQSSTAAGRSYLAVRQAHTTDVAPRSLVHLAPAPPDQMLDRAFGYSGPALLTKDTARPNTAFTTTLGTASRIALDGGRLTTIETTNNDPDAVGWYRLTDGDPCPFCALLAGRGLVYRSEGSASFLTHNDCGCSAEPAFTRDHVLPAISTQAADVYRSLPSGNSKAKLTAFRAAWSARDKPEPAPA